MIIAEIENEAEIRQRIEDDYDVGGDIFGAEYLGLRREIHGVELTLVVRNNEDLDDLLYVLLVPSTEPGYYDAWQRRAGVSYYSLLHHCRAQTPEEMQHRLREYLQNLDDE